MRGGDVNGRNWIELARVPAPVERRSLWQALLEKTENPELYNRALARAEVLDQDATVVIRRAHPARGEPYLESLTHACAEVRVEVRRHGHTWRRRQALVESGDGPCLVYQVDDAEAAATHGGIDGAYARHVLEQLVSTARAMGSLTV